MSSDDKALESAKLAQQCIRMAIKRKSPAVSYLPYRAVTGNGSGKFPTPIMADSAENESLCLKDSSWDSGLSKADMELLNQELRCAEVSNNVQADYHSRSDKYWNKPACDNDEVELGVIPRPIPQEIEANQLSGFIWHQVGQVGGGPQALQQASEPLDTRKELDFLWKGNPATKTRVKKLLQHHEAHWGQDKKEALESIKKFCTVAYTNGIRTTTASSYSSAVNSFEFFCQLFDLEPYPATEEVLVLFVGWSASRITSDSISHYLSGIRMQHINLGLEWKDRDEMPRLKRTLAGLEWMDKSKKEGRLRLALTADILEDLLQKKMIRETNLRNHGGSIEVYSLESFILSAALYTSLFCGLHRPSELAVRTTSKGITTSPVRVKHLYVDQDPTTKLMRSCGISIPSTKTDPFGERSYVEYGRTEKEMICATTHLCNLMFIRVEVMKEVVDGESFIFPVRDTKTGQLRAVTYEDLRKQLDIDLELSGRNSSHYQGHSFRIGAATTLALNGVPTSIIEDMGRWSRGSLSLPRYLRGQTSPEVRKTMVKYFGRPYVERADE